MRARSSGPVAGVSRAVAAAPTAAPKRKVKKPFILLHFFDFFSNLVGEAFEFAGFDAGHV